MPPRDSIFEKIMKSKRSQLPKRAQPGRAAPPQKLGGQGPVEMDAHHLNLANEEQTRKTELERILAIRKELSDIRHMKKKQ
ncbi:MULTISPECIES: hypothetical protein [unclassified Paenibacillus]|uniref:hypothetical protein n=1 Tax=unclassified Paenibacillus TaxID=185978 RepID=UPI001F42D9D5|nr:hypothetical protein [Paenibacillus sp. JJ-223]CAH1225726.1 hypothetical protein PAECIP111890_05830 [Paenibacillus sp. JJ-223]